MTQIPDTQINGQLTQREHPRTSIQTDNISEFDNKLQVELGRSQYNKYRSMRKDSTIALARELSIAPILSGSWGYDGEDEAQKAFIKWQMNMIRQSLLRFSLLGQIDFGWKAFEKTFAALRTPKHGMRIVIDKIKPLLNDITFALYGVNSGSFLGLFQNDLHTSRDIFIDAAHSLFVNFDDEGVNDYGEPQMARVEAPFDQWNDTNDAACRYDTKVAGSHWVIQYPVGTSNFNEEGKIDNSVIAKKVLSTLKSSGSVTIPVEVKSLLDNLENAKTGWKVELVSDAGKSSDFVTRLKYLDALKVRAMSITERSVTEGVFGTKSEAEAHFNASMMIMQLRHEMLVELFNRFIVNQLLLVNFGVENTVKLIANPLIDERTALFKELFTTLTTNTSTAPEVLEALDIEEVLDTLKIPHTEINFDDVEPVDSSPEPDENDEEEDEAVETSLWSR